jgi:hypothetical protein
MEYWLEEIIGLILLYLGAGLTALWGIAHLFPTRAVVKGFGDISLDNKRIITMEWITEGVALIFIGAVVALMANEGSAEAQYVLWLAAIVLLVLAVVSAFTGYKVKLLPFKLCPFIFATSAILIFVGSFL